MKSKHKGFSLKKRINIEADLQYQKHGLDPNQNGQLMTARIIYIRILAFKLIEDNKMVVILKIIQTLMMPIIASEAFWVGASESWQRRVTYKDKGQLT